ncbi:MAG: C1 family peptidase [Candidatus Wallbacteria bacterium]|nr:C1 family peptidase [Candidatus Wallbacteria bacterium]
MKVCILLSVFLFSLFLSIQPAAADDLVGLVQNLAILAEQEGSLYTVSMDAAPKGIPLATLCGFKRPDYADGLMHMRKLTVKNDLKLPATFDWRAQNGTTPVKNQGSCGSCWAFGCVGIFESAIAIKDSAIIDLSEQDLLDCNTQGYSCDGGYIDALQYFKEKGCADEKTIPYQQAQKQCRDVARTYKIKDWSAVDSNEAAVKQAIYTYGPIVTGVTADFSFQFYSGGVYNHNNTGEMNHAVILVGWDDTKGKKGCWIMKNSWGASWGDKGYMYIEYGCSHIGTESTCVNY